MELCRADARFTYEAYEFVCDAVTYTQERLDRGYEDGGDDDSRHVSGSELLRGVCDLAVQQFGLMAPVVFDRWGIRTTDDVGTMVFNLIQVERLSKSERDDPSDFHDLFNLRRELERCFALTLDEPQPAKRGDR